MYIVPNLRISQKVEAGTDNNPILNHIMIYKSSENQAFKIKKQEQQIFTFNYVS